MKKQTIGILGGMGPAATVDFFDRIVKLTPAKGDEEHIHVLIDNDPSVPNRIDALLHGGESPVRKLRKMARNLENIGADFLTIPCNNASYYTKDIQKVISIPILNIVDVTVDHVINNYPKVEHIGVMGTSAALKAGIYQKKLHEEHAQSICEHGHCVVVDHFVEKLKDRYKHASRLVEEENYVIEATQAPLDEDEFGVITPRAETVATELQPAISGREGVKAGNIKDARKKFVKVVKELEADGAELVVLGCTDIPVALSQKDVTGVKLIDPTHLLAKKAVELALGDKSL